MDWLDFGNFFLDEYLAYRISYETIANFQVQRTILATCYTKLLYQCEIAAIECYPEEHAEMEALANEYASHLDPKDKYQFIKAIFALTYLAQKRLDTKKTAEG